MGVRPLLLLLLRLLRLVLPFRRGPVWHRQDRLATALRLRSNLLLVGPLRPPPVNQVSVEHQHEVCNRSRHLFLVPTL